MVAAANPIQELREALRERPDPERRLELAMMCAYTLDLEEARAQLESALAEFVAAGKPRRAALAASRLTLLYSSFYGNRVAARAWFTRAWRLLEDQGPCLERGWVAVAEVSCHVDDPRELRERGEVALEMARTFKCVELEARALADSGLAMVDAGERAAGLARIDEAMALVTSGAAAAPDVAGMTCCALFTACWRAGDLGRMQAWNDVLRGRRLIGPDGLAVLTVHCDAVYGVLLCNLGRFSEAEAVLEDAMQLAASVHYGGRLLVQAALADLRICQGRLDEAEQLLVGNEDQLLALVPMARLHLGRGDLDLAVATARRGLRRLTGDQLRALELLHVVVDAAIRRGDLARARDACADIDRRMGASDAPALRAQAALARGRLASAEGDVDRAVSELDGALDLLRGHDLPLVEARVHTELARVALPRDRAAALAEARAASAIYARLEVTPCAALAETLAELGAAPAPAISARGVVTLTRADGWVTIAHQGSTFRVKDAKGFAYLAELVVSRGQERHVFDLLPAAGASDVDGQGDARAGAFELRAALGDAGPAIDDKAKAAYKRKLEELRLAAEDAREVGNHERAAVLEDEIETLAQHLSASMGLGGRDRRTCSAVERARLNVTRAVRSAIARVKELDARVGRSLDRSVRTGVLCSYAPGDAEELEWSVRS